MRTVLSLLVLTVIAAVIAVVVVREHDTVYVAEKQLLLPDLKDRVNDAARVAIKGYDGEVVLERVKDKWGISGRGQYPANFVAIKTLLVGLAQAEMIEYKTDNPDLYFKLGLAGIAVEGSSSREIEVQDEAGDPLAFLIVGDQQRLGGGRALPAYYARLPEEPRSLLVQGELRASVEVRDWLEEMILNIASDRIREIKIWNTYENVHIFRDSEEETDFQLAEIPEGMKLKAQLTLNRMGTILEEFRIDDVVAGDEFEFSEEGTAKTEIRTFDGLLIRGRAEQREEKAHVAFAFSATEPFSAGGDGGDEEAGKAEGEGAAAAKASEEAKDEASEAAAKAADPSAPAEVSSEVLREIEDLNRRLGPWVFVAPYFKYDMLARRIGPLVEDADAGTDTDADADTDADTGAGDEAPPVAPPS